MNDNKRIAVNTAILYGKLIITTVLGLLTSRYILISLGASDYGIYTVVGGIVSFMNVLGTTMVSASYRFLAVEIGKGREGNPQKIYNTVFLVHVLLATFLMVVGELGGVYYANHYLVLPDGKLPDAIFVLHISLITAVINLITVPTQGLAIARERFLFTSIVEIIIAIIKIALVICIMIYAGNRLRLFVLIMLFLTFVTFFLYTFYCFKIDHDTVVFKINKNKGDYKEIANYASWSFLGATACIANTQGASMIINIFFGTILNASYGIASQVSRYTSVFVRSITQAAVPQIMKSYSGGDKQRSVTLVNHISRYSSLALLIVFVPIVVCTEEILTIWLKEPPIYSVLFVKFLLINTFISVLGSGFDACIQSTGKIRNNEIIYSVVYLIQLPIIYTLYKLGFAPYINVILLSICTFFIRCAQLCIMKHLVEFNIVFYIKNSLIPILHTSLLSVLLPIIVKQYILGVSTSPFLLIFICLFWSLLSIWLFGIKKQEKRILIDYITHNFLKKSN